MVFLISYSKFSDVLPTFTFGDFEAFALDLVF